MVVTVNKRDKVDSALNALALDIDPEVQNHPLRM